MNKPTQQLRELATVISYRNEKHNLKHPDKKPKPQVDFSVTTRGHLWLIKFGDDLVEDIDLYTGAVAMLEIQQNKGRHLNSSAAQEAA